MDEPVEVDQLEGVVEGVTATVDADRAILLGKGLAQQKDLAETGGVDGGDLGQVEDDGFMVSGGKVGQFFLKLLRRLAV